MECPVCGADELQAREVEKWIHRGGQWALVLYQPGMVCDNCGDVSFSQEEAESLARLADESIPQTPTAFCHVKVFDRRKMAEEQAKGRRPAIVSTEPVAPNGLTPLSTARPPMDTSKVTTRSVSVRPS